MERETTEREKAMARWIGNIEEVCVRNGMQPDEQDKLGWLEHQLGLRQQAPGGDQVGPLEVTEAGDDERGNSRVVLTASQTMGERSKGAVREFALHLYKEVMVRVDPYGEHQPTREYAESLLRTLSAVYEEPVMPVSRYCKALETWAKAVQQCHDGRLLEVAKHFDEIAMAIRKSNLLFRLIYLGEQIRTVPCPVHKGVWSGCKPDGECECMSGFNVTGWLPNEDAKS